MNAYLESNQHISCQDTWKPWESNLFVQNSKAQELDPVQKNLISHRGQALRELISQLQLRP